VLLGTASINGGVLADLIDGMKVEAEGHNVTGGVLAAEKITIKDNIRIEANAATNGASVLGKTVTITSGTRLDNLASGASITTNDGLRIRGFVNRDGSTITATRVTKLSNAVAADKIIIQGPVKNIDATGHAFTIMGISITTTGTSIARPNDDNGTDTLTMPMADFFSSLVADRTIVKAKGTFSGGGLVATEIELE
jgi:NDP-sugar pyrophosphorylase family protein